jgi:hypothetical protein
VIGKLEYATGAFLADLLRPLDADEPNGWVYRSLKKTAFTGAAVTRRTDAAPEGALKPPVGIATATAIAAYWHHRFSRGVLGMQTGRPPLLTQRDLGGQGWRGRLWGLLRVSRSELKERHESQ